MTCFSEIINENIHEIAIVGHVHPDGDCVGSVMAVYHYLTDNFPEIHVTPYLEKRTEDLLFLTEGLDVREDSGEGEDYDLLISVDVSDIFRTGAGAEAFNKALEEDKVVCIDHHGTNPGFGRINHTEPLASSTCEVLTGLFDMEKVSRTCAICLFTGIIHDTGVFKYDSTSPRTLRMAAELVEKGLPYADIIQRSYTDHAYQEMKISGEVLSEGKLYKDERVFVAYCPIEKTLENGLSSRNLGGIVAELCNIRECDVVLFLYQYEDGTWKGSLRSKCDVDVAKIAKEFGGGGHKKAAGFSVEANLEEVEMKVRSLVKEMRNQ